MRRLGEWFTSARVGPEQDETLPSDLDEQGLAMWANERSEVVEAIRHVQKNRSWTADELGRAISELKPDERIHGVVDSVHLVEPRRGTSDPAGSYTGFSVRRTKSLQWNDGELHRWYAPGPDQPRIVDSGTVTITDQRMVFHGRTRLREFPFAKLVDYQHLTEVPVTLVRLSNRRTTSGIAYRGGDAVAFQLALASAVAHAVGTESELLSGLRAELAELEARRPIPPSPNV